MMRLRLVGLSCLVIAAIPCTADALCKDGALCVDELSANGDVELRARNLQDFPITFTLSVKARNYSIAGPNTVTQTLGPGESQKVMLLSGDDGGDKGSYRYDFKWAVGRQDARHDDEQLYALPYGSDFSYRVLQGYGSRFSHTGREEFTVDFDMSVGTAVHAARSGVVARVQESHSKGCWDDDCGQYANYIVILHTDGTTGEYYHLAENGAFVQSGDTVVRGQKIGLSGNTGHTTMPHLHFGVYRPVEWGRTQSIAVRFDSSDGIIHRPRRGARYQTR